MSIHTSSLLLLALSIGSLAFPENVKRCKFDDYDCQMVAANVIFGSYFGGLDLLGLPSIDPLKIDRLDIAQSGNESVKIDLKMRKAKLGGLSMAKLYKLSGFQRDPEKNKLEMSFKTPHATLVGPYIIKGQMLILPIAGKGDCTMKFENLDVHLKFLTKKVQKGDKIFMEVVKQKSMFKVSNSSVHMTNLFNGDKTLGDNMNLFLNQNGNLLLEELSKPINSAFAVIFRDVLNSVFSKIPYHDLFIE